MSIVKGINVEHKHEEEQTKKSPEKFQFYYLIIKPITYHRGLLTWGVDFYNQNNGAMLTLLNSALGGLMLGTTVQTLHH